MGIPTNLFTVLFAVARAVGWMAQWIEMVSHPMKVGRPRQRYVGHGARDYLPLSAREPNS
jgi:citrate synthase